MYYGLQVICTDFVTKIYSQTCFLSINIDSELPSQDQSWSTVPFPAEQWDAFIHETFN